MSTFPKSKCDTVVAAMYRDGNTDMLAALGLVEYVGHNTRQDASSEPVPVTRRPLWETPVIDELTTGLNYQRGRVDDGYWADLASIAGGAA